MKKGGNACRSTHTHTDSFRKKKGITLIALIITIIVMLILVAVTVTVALNGNLFTKTNKAAKNTQIEAEKERILADYYAFKAKKIDGEEVALSISDASEVTGNETSGWQITLNSGNKYTLSKDGNLQYVDPNKKVIDPNWYIPTEAELSNFYSQYGMYFVALKSNYTKMIIYNENAWGEGSTLIDVAVNGEHIYISNQATADALVEDLEDREIEIDVNIEVGKWYIVDEGSHPHQIELYTGSCPVSADDFADGEVFSESYLQKIIDSFGE